MYRSQLDGYNNSLSRLTAEFLWPPAHIRSSAVTLFCIRSYSCTQTLTVTAGVTPAKHSKHKSFKSLKYGMNNRDPDAYGTLNIKFQWVCFLPAGVKDTPVVVLLIRHFWVTRAEHLLTDHRTLLSGPRHPVRVHLKVKKGHLTFTITSVIL